MPAYKAPLREIQFVLNEVLQFENLPQQIPDFSEATPDLVATILEEAGKFAGGVLAALVGYRAQPALTSVLAYAGFWLAMAALMARGKRQAAAR